MRKTLVFIVLSRDLWKMEENDDEEISPYDDEHALLTSGNGGSSRHFVRERENIRPNNII